MVLLLVGATIGVLPGLLTAYLQEAGQRRQSISDRKFNVLREAIAAHKDMISKSTAIYRDIEAALSADPFKTMQPRVDAALGQRVEELAKQLASERVAYESKAGATFVLLEAAFGSPKDQFLIATPRSPQKELERAKLLSDRDLGRGNFADLSVRSYRLLIEIIGEYSAQLSREDGRITALFLNLSHSLLRE